MFLDKCCIIDVNFDGGMFIMNALVSNSETLYIRIMIFQVLKHYLKLLIVSRIRSGNMR